MTRTLPKILGALAFVSAMAIGTATPSTAQGVYLNGPGFEVGVGHPWYRHHHYYYDYGRPYHRSWRHRYYDWDRY
jgi:hypothetical protein